MTQTELFPSVTGQINVKGDIASDKSQYLWVVECKVGEDEWTPTYKTTTNRRDARLIAAEFRSYGEVVRIIPYKACIDSKGRHNRQVQGERIL